jgi:hypothetical protein
MRKTSAKIVLLACCAMCQTALFAQSEGDSNGFLFNETIQGSRSSVGMINKLDTAVGYQFNRYLAVEGGLPVYFVNPSSSTMVATGATSQNGIGNAYLDFRLTLLNPAINYISLATVAAPTGDKSTGFSTGHVTYDWSNLFDHSFGRLTPFVNLGIANTITDTPFFVRPFTSYGFVTHVEGGASYKIVRALSVGASVYDIAPSGQQTVYSKLIKSGHSGTGQGHHGVFEQASVTVGTADIARDHGFSAWFTVKPWRYTAFEIGYSRSVEYALDSIFYGVNFNLGPLVRRHF